MVDFFSSYSNNRFNSYRRRRHRDIHSEFGFLVDGYEWASVSTQPVNRLATRPVGSGTQHDATYMSHRWTPTYEKKGVISEPYPVSHTDLSLGHNLVRPPIIDLFLSIITSSDPRSSTFFTYRSIHLLALTSTSLDYPILSILKPLVDLFAILPTFQLNPDSVPLKRCTSKG